MAEELLNRVNTLRGDNLSDILKSFNHLVRENHEAFLKNVPTILELLNGEDTLQKFIRLTLIDKFEQSDQVLKILKSGDKFALKRALKCRWFFKQVPDTQVLINDVIPHLSYCTRLQVIKQYSKNLCQTDAIENLFKSLVEKYDLSTAFRLLPACSQKFVKDRLPTFKTKVPAPVLLELFKRYPDLGKEYLEFILESIAKGKRAFRCINMDDYDTVFSHLASSDPKMFIRIYIKYSNMPYLHFGKRIALKIIKTDTDAFINHFDKFSNLISMKITRSILSIDQLERLQLVLFPKSITLFFSMRSRADFIEVTKKIKRETRAEILMKNFHKAFGRAFVFNDFSHALNVDIIEHFPKEIIVKWVELTLPKKESCFDKSDLIQYLPTSTSIPLLKKLVENQSELNGRVHIIKTIFKNLDFNNDLKTLPSILTYFVSRFRNDQTPMRNQVFCSLVEFQRLLMAFEEDDWKTIDELLKLVKLNKEQEEFRFEITKIQKAKLLYYFKRGVDMESHLEDYIQAQKSLFDACDFEVVNSFPISFNNIFLLFYLSKFPEMKCNDKNKVILINKLVSNIYDYNLLNKRNQILIPDWLVENIVSIVKNNKTDLWTKINFVNYCKMDPNLSNNVISQIFPHFFNAKITSFVMKRTPSKILENIDDIMKKFMEARLDAEEMRFFRRLRMYSTFGLPQKIVEICYQILKKADNGSKYTAKPNAIIILCLLLPETEFLKLAEQYYPTSLKIEYEDSEDSVYRIQQEIASCLKLLNNPILALGPMKKFSGGDYLKYVVGSINSVCLQIPEVEIIPILKEWMDSRVSVRKHFIRIFFKVSPKESKCALVKELFAKEENTSMRLMLFEHALQLFCKEPCKESFESFKTIASGLQPSDTSAIEKMFHLEKVVDDYVSIYIEMLWELVSLKESEIQSSDKNKVIALIDKEVLQLLNEGFCEMLLSQIFSRHNLENVHLIEFVIYYILCSSDNDTQAARLDKTMIYLKNLIDAHWREYNLGSYFVFPVRKFLSILVKTLCEKSHERENLYIDPGGALKEFKTQLKAMLPCESFIEESILIDFTIKYHGHFVQKPDTNTFPELFFEFIKSYLEKLADVNDAVKVQAIKETLPMHLLKGDGTLLLAKQLLSDPSELCNLIGLSVVPKRINDDKFVAHYETIISLIIENRHQSVKILTNSVLTKLISTVVV